MAYNYDILDALVSSPDEFADDMSYLDAMTTKFDCAISRDLAAL